MTGSRKMLGFFFVNNSAQNDKLSHRFGAALGPPILKSPLLQLFPQRFCKGEEGGRGRNRPKFLPSAPPPFRNGHGREEKSSAAVKLCNILQFFLLLCFPAWMEERRNYKSQLLYGKERKKGRKDRKKLWWCWNARGVLHL